MLRIPDYITPLRGYRLWRVDEHGTLWAVVYEKYSWPYAPIPAHEASVDAKNERGFYAMRPNMLNRFNLTITREFYDYLDYSALRRINWHGDGVVDLWGKVIVHEDGYRAEYAYPRSIRGRFPEYVAEAIRRNYHIQVEVIRPTAELKAQFLAAGKLALFAVHMVVIIALVTGVMGFMFSFFGWALDDTHPLEGLIFEPLTRFVRYLFKLFLLGLS